MKKLLLGICIGIVIELLIILLIGLSSLTPLGHWGEDHFYEFVMFIPLSVTVILLVFYLVKKKSYGLICGILLGIIIFIASIFLFVTGL
jgi:hypothetical protein